MKPIKVIKDPEAFQLLADETRRRVVFLLRAKEMTVSEIASSLGVTPQAIYHHIKKMQKADLVEVAREERVGHLIESYYRATAEVFMCSIGSTPQSRGFALSQMRTVLGALRRVGFDLEYGDDDVAGLVDIEVALGECCDAEDRQKAVSALEDIDVLTKQTIQKYVEILSMTDGEFSRRQELTKRFRDSLRSLLKG